MFIDFGGGGGAPGKPPSQGPTKPVKPGSFQYVPAPQPSSDPEEAGAPYYDPSNDTRNPVDPVDRVDRVDDAPRVATFQTRLQGADTGSERAREGLDKDAARQTDADSDDSDDSKELRERYRAASNIQDRYDRTAALAAIWKALVAKKTGSVVATRDVNTKDFFTPEERVQMERNGFKDTPAFRKSILDSGHEVAASRAAHYIQAEIREENAQKRGNLGVVGKQQRIKSALLKGDTETVRKAFNAENSIATTTPAPATPTPAPLPAASTTLPAPGPVAGRATTPTGTATTGNRGGISDELSAEYAAIMDHAGREEGEWNLNETRMAAFWQKVLAEHGIDRDDSPAVADTAYNRFHGTNLERVASNRAKSYMNHARRFETESEPGIAEVRRLTGGAPPNPALHKKIMEDLLRGDDSAKNAWSRAFYTPGGGGAVGSSEAEPATTTTTTPAAGATTPPAQTAADPAVPAAEWMPSAELKAQHKESLQGTDADRAAFAADRDAEKAAWEAAATTTTTTTPAAGTTIPAPATTTPAPGPVAGRATTPTDTATTGNRGGISDELSGEYKAIMRDAGADEEYWEIDEPRMAEFWQKVLAEHGIDRDDSPAVADTAYNRFHGTDRTRVASNRAEAYMNAARRFETESDPYTAEVRRLTGGARPNPALHKKIMEDLLQGDERSWQAYFRKEFAPGGGGAVGSSVAATTTTTPGSWRNHAARPNCGRPRGSGCRMDALGGTESEAQGVVAGDRRGQDRFCGRQGR